MLLDRRFIKSVMALSLVPVDKVDDGWIELDANSPGPAHPGYARLNLFKNYFISTWLESEEFPRELWNHYGLVFESGGHDARALFRTAFFCLFIVCCKDLNALAQIPKISDSKINWVLTLSIFESGILASLNSSQKGVTHSHFPLFRQKHRSTDDQPSGRMAQRHEKTNQRASSEHFPNDHLSKSR